jgi:hypothetical protein
MACVPPVELPNTTGLLTDSACSPAIGGAGARALTPAPGAAGAARGRKRATAFSVCTSSRRESSRNCFTRRLRHHR